MTASKDKPPNGDTTSAQELIAAAKKAQAEVALEKAAQEQEAAAKRAILEEEIIAKRTAQEAKDMRKATAKTARAKARPIKGRRRSPKGHTGPS